MLPKSAPGSHSCSLWSILRAAARVILPKCKLDHVIFLLKTVQQLPISFRWTFRCLIMAPGHCEIRPCSPRWPSPHFSPCEPHSFLLFHEPTKHIPISGLCTCPPPRNCFFSSFRSPQAEGLGLICYRVPVIQNSARHMAGAQKVLNEWVNLYLNGMAPNDSLFWSTFGWMNVIKYLSSCHFPGEKKKPKNPNK